MGSSGVQLKRDKSTKNDGYGPKGVVCDRKPTQSCYNIPRKIQVEVCKTDVHRYCEKYSIQPLCIPRRGWSAPTSLRRLAMMWTGSTATRSRRSYLRKYVI